MKMGSALLEKNRTHDTSKSVFDICLLTLIHFWVNMNLDFFVQMTLGL